MRCLIHRFDLVVRTISYEYSECVNCGERKAEKVRPDRYEPLETDWLEHKKEKFNRRSGILYEKN